MANTRMNPLNTVPMVHLISALKLAQPDVQPEDAPAVLFAMSEDDVFHLVLDYAMQLERTARRKAG